MNKYKQAKLMFWSGYFTVVEFFTGKVIARSKLKDSRSVLYRARKMGYSVTLYEGLYESPDVLPPIK